MTKVANNQTNAFRGPADQIKEATTFDLDRAVAKGKANTEAAAKRRAGSDIAGEFSKEDFSWKKLDGQIVSSLDKNKKTEGDLKPEMSSAAKDMLVAHNDNLDASPETTVSENADKRTRS